MGIYNELNRFKAHNHNRPAGKLLGELKAICYTCTSKYSIIQGDLIYNYLYILSIQTIIKVNIIIIICYCEVKNLFL